MMFVSKCSILKMTTLFVAVIFLLPQSAAAQAAAKNAKPQAQNAVAGSGGYVIKTYDVADLVMNIPDYPYSISRDSGRHPLPAGMGGMGGGMGGVGMGGGMGGGMFNVQDSQAGSGGFGRGGLGGAPSSAGTGMPIQNMGGPMPASLTSRSTMPSLIEVITTIVAVETWSEVGGECALTALGNSLVVRQTPDGHRQIEELLKQLRAGAHAKKTVSIDARWLLLDSDDLDRLVSAEGDGCPCVDRKILADYTRRPTSIRAITNCFTGQLVYLVSGTRRNEISGYTPVVGSADQPQDRAGHLVSTDGGPLVTNAQLMNRSAVGYQPQIEKTNLGTLLEIRATLIPDEKRAVVDLRSTITMPGMWHADAAQLAGQMAQHILAPVVDRIATEKQQFATTLSMPLGQPVLAGGITFSSKPGEPSEITSKESKGTQPGKALKKASSHQAMAAAEDAQLYLILELR